MGKNNIFLMLNFFVSLALLLSLGFLWYRMGKLEGRMAQIPLPVVPSQAMSPAPPIPQSTGVIAGDNDDGSDSIQDETQTAQVGPTLSVSEADKGVPGKDWGLVTRSTGYRSHYGTVPLVFNGMIFAVGGEGLDAVWESTDGDQWTEAAPDFYIPSLCHGATVFKGRLWAVGGRGRVSSSADGVHWDLATDNAPFGPRNKISLTAFNGRLWMIGGVSNDVMDDVWCSDDGKNWQCALVHAPFLSRRDHQATVFNGKIWITGGIHDSVYTPLDDIWNSPDGFHWQQVPAGPHYSGRHSFGFVAYQGKLWVTAGDNGKVIGGVGDVWNSPDGIHWDCVNPDAGPVFRGRTANQAFVFKDRLWILGGYTGTVWCSPSLPASGSN